MRSGRAATELVVWCLSVQLMWLRLIVVGVALGARATGRKETVRVVPMAHVQWSLD